MVRPIEVRKIPAEVDPDQLVIDLNTLSTLAREVGAGEVFIVRAGDVIFNREILTRVRSGAEFPSCHWPVNYPKDSLEEAIGFYRKGIFFIVPHTGDIPEYFGGLIMDASHRKAYRKVYEIVSRVESAAFYLGYHLALGLARGNCRTIFCPGQRECVASKKGERCLHPLRSRPSLEAVGIDAREMARKMGTDLPSGGTAFLTGLVMVA